MGRNVTIGFFGQVIFFLYIYIYIYIYMCVFVFCVECGYICKISICVTDNQPVITDFMKAISMNADWPL